MSKSSKSKPKKPVNYDLFGNPIEEPDQLLDGLVQEAEFPGGAKILYILIKGEPWFVADEVCGILEIRSSGVSEALSRLDPDEKGNAIVVTPGGPQNKAIINESGLYSLIMTSRKPEAKAFRKWVTSEVLPSIRKTGTYSAKRLTDRVKKKMKELRCDQEVAVRRLEGIDLNSALNKKGSSPHASAIHNVIYESQFDGKDAKALKDELELKPWQTVYDHMGLHPIVQGNYIKSVAALKIAAEGVEAKDRLLVYKEIAKQRVTDERTELGDAYSFAVRNDPQRGKILDVVPTKLSEPSSAPGPTAA